MIAGMHGVLDKLDPKPESEQAEGKDEGKDEGEGEVVSLAAAIETRKFLGPEFLAWLWFESEIFEQQLTLNLSDGPREQGAGCGVQGAGDGSAVVELWLEKQITFQALTETGVEKASLSGLAPSGGEEAKEALRQGKMPVKAKLGVRLSDTEAFSFVFDAPTFALSSVKIPALLKGEGDDPFCERMTLIEKIEGLVELLYRDFLELRLGAQWNTGNWSVATAMHAWAFDTDMKESRITQYRALRGR